MKFYVGDHQKNQKRGLGLKKVSWGALFTLLSFDGGRTRKERARSRARAGQTARDLTLFRSKVKFQKFAMMSDF